MASRAPVPEQHARSRRVVIIYGIGLGISCLIAFWVSTRLLGEFRFISRDDGLLGGMWAVVATVFVYHDTREQSAVSALSRMAATLVSFVLCLAYLLVLPFYSLGLAALIGIGAIFIMLLGRPQDTVTTGITTTVVMVVADLAPQDAWLQPILRLFDTLIGTGIGLAAAWLSFLVARYYRVSRAESS